MNPPEFFEQIGQRGFYRPRGVVTYAQALSMASDAMNYARFLELRDLLINVHGLTGFTSPSVAARYELALMWAESAAGRLRVALVVRPDVMDPEKIAVLMAQNRGVAGDAFLTEAEGIAWLDRYVAGARTT
jgi:hypothetical protein